MTKKVKVPFWIQIVAIILVGVISSVSIAFYYQDKKIERHTVTFAYGNGDVIERKTVKDGKGIYPIVFSTEGVFRGWNGAINNITSDIEVHPMIYNITDENLFYFDSVYIKEGKNFTINIYVAGKVNVSSGQLIINFDPKVAKYKRSKCAVFSNVEENKDGELSVKFNSNYVIKDKTLIAQLTFKAKKMDVYSTEITVSGKEVKVLESGGEKSVDFATINNNIFYLQEVSK